MDNIRVFVTNSMSEYQESPGTSLGTYTKKVMKVSRKYLRSNNKVTGNYLEITRKEHDMCKDRNVMGFVAGFVRYGHFLGFVTTFCDKSCPYLTNPAKKMTNPKGGKIPPIYDKPHPYMTNPPTFDKPHPDLTNPAPHI